MSRTRAAIATAVAALGVATAAAPAQAAEAWTQVGAPISAGPVDVTATPNSPPDSDLKGIAGSPYVAWVEGGVVRVARLESSTWVPVGGALNRDPAATATGPSLAEGPGETPWIAWIEDQGGMDRVRVARFDRATDAWVEVAPNSTINRVTSPEPFLNSARQARLVFVGGRAHVVFRQENPSAYETGLVRLSADGASWERLASPPADNEPYYLAAHVADGALHVAVRDLIGAVVVSRYVAATNSWTRLGGLANPGPDPTPAGLPLAMTDVAGVIHVLMSTDGGIFVTRFSGGTWEIVGPGSVGDGQVSSIRLIGGRLYVSWWDDTGVRVSRLNAAGTAWEALTAPFPAGGILPGVLTGISGVPYLSYATRADLRVARLDGVTHTGPDDHDDSEPPQAGCGRELFGTRRNDRLRGTGGNDLIRGLRGNDTIIGLAGDDCLFGDEGNDRIEGGEGVDTIAGGDGEDRIVSGAGNDNVRAGSGNDVVDSRGRGFDTIDCGPGRDRALVGDLDRVRNCERVENVD